MNSASKEQYVVCSYQLDAGSHIRKRVDLEQFTCVGSRPGAYWPLLDEHPYLRG